MFIGFVVEFGEGCFIIGILGEYDVLFGLLQDVFFEKILIEEGGVGYGCGYNLFGVGSLGVVVVIKELIVKGELSGMICFYGILVEEKYFGKFYMVCVGMFDDLDVCFDWYFSF